MKPSAFILWCISIFYFQPSLAKHVINGHEGRHLLQKCINENQPLSNLNPYGDPEIGTTWRATLLDRGSRFNVLGTWWSIRGPPCSKPLSEGVTIVTHLSFDERSQLKTLCRSWRGPLSAVIHFTTLDANAVKRDSMGQTEQQDALNTAMRPAVRDMANWTSGMGREDAPMSEPDELDSSGSDYAELERGSSEIADRSDELPATLGRKLAMSVTKQKLAQRRGRTLQGSGNNDVGSRSSGGSASLDDRLLSIDEAKRHVKGLHEALERMNACQADIILVHEVYSDQRSLAMYPGPLLQVDMDSF